MGFTLQFWLSHEMDGNLETLWGLDDKPSFQKTKDW